MADDELIDKLRDGLYSDGTAVGGWIARRNGPNRTANESSEADAGSRRIIQTQLRQPQELPHPAPTSLLQATVAIVRDSADERTVKPDSKVARRRDGHDRTADGPAGPTDQEEESQGDSVPAAVAISTESHT
ncbi:hypothetical protein BV898_09806 [Hypsibius exemplaris]|uniref:Uncharacterized protein n=1 Tax=Hypsibius exemplaris TaxID=2072580 RepID=A0A1W0WLF0_HYPEX|nr:hypothetical protein BV898_09806 [Hypsibius exemplaris]